jgi:hypothetical protein
LAEALLVIAEGVLSKLGCVASRLCVVVVVVVE